MKIVPIPWMVDKAVEWLREYVKPGMTILEFGGGGSTLFFNELGAHTVTIESDTKWCKQIRKQLPKADIREIGVREPLGDLLDEVDLLTVDTRDQDMDRVEIVRHHATRVKPGGALLLDNAERPRYATVYYLLRHWGLTTLRQGGVKTRYGQPQVAFDYTKRWETNIWRRRPCST